MNDLVITITQVGRWTYKWTLKTKPLRESGATFTPIGYEVGHGYAFGRERARSRAEQFKTKTLRQWQWNAEQAVFGD